MNNLMKALGTTHHAAGTQSSVPMVSRVGRPQAPPGLVMSAVLPRIMALAALLWPPAVANAALELLEPGFRLQSSLKSVHFPAATGHCVVAGGRDEAGSPYLGLVRIGGESAEFRRMALPADTVALDTGPAGPQRDAVFVLTTDRVLRLDRFDGALQTVAEVDSVYRGTSFSAITGGLDFARDIDGDNVAELVVPDFDVLRVVDEQTATDLELPSYRRSYGTDAIYAPAEVMAAPGVAGHQLHVIRGNDLLTYRAGRTAPDQHPLPLGLSDDLLREKFYNGDDDIDQADIVLREVSEFADITGDGIPDVTTLEIVSTGVFDKTTTYRVHFGQVVGDALSFRAEADLELSSRGYQVGSRVAELSDAQNLLVSSSVKVGVGALVGALFSRAVTLRTEILPLDATTAGGDREPTVIKSRIRFDLDSGRVALPTIEFGDLDGDGINDLLLKTRNQRFGWRAGRATGTFARSEQAIELAAPADGEDVALADLTGDGRAEIVLYYGSGDPADVAGRIGVFRPSMMVESEEVSQ